MESIYVFGHKNPDTDSVTASISLAYLKKCLGQKVEPRVLGTPNNETKYALDKFGVEQPKYLNDVKLQIKDLNYQKNFYCNSNESIYEGYMMMHDKTITTLPIIDDNNKLYGIVSMKDVANYQMNEQVNELDTSYQNILDVLGAEEIVKCDEEIKGHILVASYRSTTFIENVEIKNDSILIVGDRHSIIEYAVNNKAKMLILTGNAAIKEEHIEIAKKNKVNIVRIDKDTFTIAKKIWLSNYIRTICLTDNIITFNENDYVVDFISALNSNTYSNYPVINNNGKCLGLLRAANANDATKKKVILVDHNEASQSADGLEEAEIVEIIDHHKIGTIGTKVPINFRNMPVGSTNTIIYFLYKENGIEIPKNIAGLMLSGIISDTLLFKSPTTTNLDITVVKDLAKIAGVDYNTYGMELLKAGSSLKGKTKDEILFSDFKNFTINDKKIGVGQIITLNIDEIKKEQDEYISLINNVQNNNDYYIVALFATDIIDNGSYIFFNDDAKEILKSSFDKNLEQGFFIKDCVSRKKQIIPNIINAIEKIS